MGMNALLFGFLGAFLIVQAIAIAGCLATFRLLGSVRAWLVALCYAAYFNCAYIFMFAPPSADPSSRAIVAYLLLYPFFSYMLVCLAVAPLYVAAGLCSLGRRGLRAARAPARVPVDTGRRDFVVRMCGAGIMLPVAGVSMYGSWVGGSRLSIEEQELWFRSLPEGMDGWRLVQISDIHAGPFMDQYRLSSYVEIISGLDPHLVVITGDIINWGDQYVSETAEALSKIKARAGVFAILGNHDFYCDVATLCRRLAQAKVLVLRNRWQEIYRNGSEAGFIAGIDDPRSIHRRPALDQALQGMPREGFRMLLAHRPNAFEQAVAAGMHLTLAGHTHGGQVIVPLPPGSSTSLSRLAYERDRGLYRSGEALLYVNRGLGVVGPPVRINCPREITRIVLRKAV